MITTVGAYVLIAIYFLMERRSRKDETARSLKPGPYDRGSHFVYVYEWITSLFFLLLAPMLNLIDAGRLGPEWLIGRLGLVLTAFGLALRYWAAIMLGEFHTRTLLVKEGHKVIQHGPYRIIRHPGYLGIMCLLIGSAIATPNLATFKAIPVIMTMVVLYRIYAEERMLQIELGEEHKQYVHRTWRLIPLVY
jgi:protein-S-isoprenylcysteine O-methyltransferase Ste14